MDIQESLRDPQKIGFSPPVGGLLTLGTNLYTRNLRTRETRVLVY